MRAYFLYFLLIVSVSSNAQTWQWWNITSGGNNYNICYPVLLQTDTLNNLYVGNFVAGDSINIGNHTFRTAGQLEFDTIHQNSLCIVTKYDTKGNILWTRANSWGYCCQYDIAPDGLGNLYELVTAYGDSAQFDGLSLPATYYDSTWYADFPTFLIKYNEDGTILWIKNIGQITNYGLSPVQLKTDKAGNIYICGAFYDPSTAIGQYTLYKEQDGLGTFLAKLDTSGNFLWVKQMGYISTLGGLKMTIGSNDDIYIMGEKQFIIRMDANGNELMTIESPGAIAPACITTDGSGNIYTGGYIGLLPGKVTMIGNYSFTSPRADSYYVYVGVLIKYDSSGNVLDAKCLGPSPDKPTPLASIDTNNCITAIAIDSCSNIWVAGSMYPTAGILLDNTTVAYAPTQSMNPMFIAEYDNSGNLLDHQVFSGGESSEAYGTNITVDNSSNIYVGGAIYINPFKLGSNTMSISNNSQFFVAKYEPEIPCGSSVFKNGSDINIFPNPASTSLNIISTHKISNVTVIDIPGQIIYRIDNNSEKVDINVSGLAAGMYFVKINGTEVRKFIKM